MDSFASKSNRSKFPANSSLKIVKYSADLN